jgi:hypothetical protein
VDKSSLISESYQQGKLEFAIVPDFLANDSWSEVLDGITSIIHLASPLAREVAIPIFAVHHIETLTYAT